jgi:hypothetical protein
MDKLESFSTEITITRMINYSLDLLNASWILTAELQEPNKY